MTKKSIKTFHFKTQPFSTSINLCFETLIEKFKPVFAENIEIEIREKSNILALSKFFGLYDCAARHKNRNSSMECSCTSGHKRIERIEIHFPKKSELHHRGVSKRIALCGLPQCGDLRTTRRKLNFLIPEKLKWRERNRYSETGNIVHLFTTKVKLFSWFIHFYFLVAFFQRSNFYSRVFVFFFQLGLIVLRWQTVIFWERNIF